LRLFSSPGVRGECRVRMYESVRETCRREIRRRGLITREQSWRGDASDAFAQSRAQVCAIGIELSNANAPGQSKSVCITYVLDNAR